MGWLALKKRQEPQMGCVGTPPLAGLLQMALPQMALPQMVLPQMLMHQDCFGAQAQD